MAADAQDGRAGARRLGAVALVAAVVGVAFGGGVSFLAYRQLASPGSAPLPIRTSGGGGGSQSVSLSSVVAAVAPSVVVVVRQQRGGGVPTAADASDGFVASSQGLIVTSEGAVAGAAGVEVVLANGDVLPATIASSDPYTGVVLLQVSSPALPAPLSFGSPPALGSTAIAISLALGGSASVDVGTVSELGLTAEVADPAAPSGSALIDGMMRTDVPAPQGSSGAPLVDASGQVVGILNGERMAPSGQGPGYFALDASEAAYLVTAITTNGSGPQPLGMVSQYLTPATAAALQLASGAEILVVDPGSVAAAAGLKAGDVVVSADGSPVLDAGAPSFPALSDLLTSFGPGAKVTLVVQRGGARRTLTLSVPVA